MRFFFPVLLLFFSCSFAKGRLEERKQAGSFHRRLEQKGLDAFCPAQFRLERLADEKGGWNLLLTGGDCTLMIRAEKSGDTVLFQRIIVNMPDSSFTVEKVKPSVSETGWGNRYEFRFSHDKLAVAMTLYMKSTGDDSLFSLSD